MKPYLELIILCSILSSCCFNNIRTVLEEPDFHAEKKVLVYQDNRSNIGTKLLRGALRKEGIKVLKYTSNTITHISEKTSEDLLNKETTVATYNKVDGSPYIIDLTYNIDPSAVCLTGETATLYRNIIVEITNLKTKEVVYSVSAQGLDGECGYCTTNVWDEIAKKIATFWKNDGQAVD